MAPAPASTDGKTIPALMIPRMVQFRPARNCAWQEEQVAVMR
jgi:hypothetical protein